MTDLLRLVAMLGMYRLRNIGSSLWRWEQVARYTVYAKVTNGEFVVKQTDDPERFESFANNRAWWEAA